MAKWPIKSPMPIKIAESRNAATCRGMYISRSNTADFVAPVAIAPHVQVTGYIKSHDSASYWSTSYGCLNLQDIWSDIIVDTVHLL